jgi:hypothetical protein
MFRPRDIENWSGMLQIDELHMLGTVCSAQLSAGFP